MSINDVHQTFWEHVEELRKTLLYVIATIFIGMLIALFFYQRLFHFLSAPLNQPLVILNPAEGMGAVMKMCLWAGLSATSPLWLLFIFRFAAPALRAQERKMILPFFFLSFLFFGGGLLFAFYLTIPLANNYLMAFNEGIGINLWSLSHYLNYTWTLLFATALSFEFCVVLFFLIHYGVITAEMMKKKRKIMCVAIFIVSALLTPPDVLTQFLLAIPLLGLYELGILYAKFKNHLTFFYCKRPVFTN